MICIKVESKLQFNLNLMWETKGVSQMFSHITATSPASKFREYVFKCSVLR
jgi:hypothetical protein